MDFKNMTDVEALRAAKDASGLSITMISQRSGISAHVLTQYFRNQDGYSPGLNKIADLCLALDNTILLQWLEAQSEAYPDEVVPPAQSRAEVLTAVSRAAAALGDVHRLVAEAEFIHPHHAREIRSALDDVIAECRVAKDKLQPLAANHDLDCMPLACLRLEPEEKREWWRFWKGFKS